MSFELASWGLQSKLQSILTLISSYMQPLYFRIASSKNVFKLRISFNLWPGEPLLRLLKEGACLAKVALAIKTSVSPMKKFFLSVVEC